MNWYYVEAGQQAGPVDDAGLSALVNSGKISLDTLVWNESMPNWQPYSSVQAPVLRMSSIPAVPDEPPIVEAPPIVGHEVVCAECGKLFAASDTIAYGNVRVCAKCKPIFVQKLSEGVKVGGAFAPVSFNYAGFWIRFAAKFIDNLIIGAILLIPFFILVALSAASGSKSPDAILPFLQVIVQLGFLFINIIYSGFFLGKYGATPGKMACRLKVVTADGHDITYGRGFGRGAGEFLSRLICGIGYIIVGFDEEKRALHDRICNTRVIYK